MGRRSRLPALCASLAALALHAMLALPAHAVSEAEPPLGNGNRSEGNVRAEHSSYKGSIVIPGADEANAASAASRGCTDCTWELVVACSSNDPNGVTDVLCSGASAGCPPGETRVRVYLTQPPEPQRQVGTACVGGPNAVVTAADVSEAAQRAFRSMPLTGAAPRLAQRSAPLVHLATYFQVDGPQTQNATVALAGYQLVITAKASYRWDFGDGTSLTTELPGRGFRPGDNTRQPPGPADAVTHWYRTPGDASATVQTTWTATYTFIDTDVIAVPGDVTPPAVALPVRIHEGRTTLYN